MLARDTFSAGLLSVAVGFFAHTTHCMVAKNLSLLN